jgi:hypothetical protein
VSLAPLAKWHPEYMRRSALGCPLAWYAIKHTPLDSIVLRVMGPFADEPECQRWCNGTNATESGAPSSLDQPFLDFVPPAIVEGETR